MPIDGTVIDAVAHLMFHYFEDHPQAREVDEVTLAPRSRGRGVCPGCVARLVELTEASDFADAIGRVWDSAAWQALRSRTLGDKGGG